MLKHAKVSGKADGVDPTLVQPSDWNDDHVFTGDVTLPGNLGIKRTPDLWGSSFAICCFGGGGAVGGGVGNASIGLWNNAFYDGSVYKYLENAAAQVYSVNSGIATWSTAPAGVAGGTVALTERMRLNNNGVLLIGGSNTNGDELLHIDGRSLLLGATCIGGWPPAASNLLTVFGGLYTGDMSGTQIRLAPAGSGVLNVVSFGNEAYYSTQGLNSLDGNGVRMVCVSNGVILSNGASSWAAISERAAKKDIQPIPGDPFAIIMAHEIALFRYLADPPTASLRPGLFYEDALANYSWATVTKAAETRSESKTDPRGVVTHATQVFPAYKGISLEQYVPLLMAAFKKQITFNITLEARLAAAGIP